MTDDSPVRDFYRGKNVFITGATGFLGIALLEKLLRSCDVGTVYLLMRAKKGKDVSERLEELKKNLVFEKLKGERGDGPLGKLVAVAGDVGEEDLGLSPTDRQTLVDNVNVVFHSAATLDFEAGLKPTVTINLLGTRRVIELCSQVKNMKVLVHVSSAYVNANRNTADEVIYDVPQKAEEAIHLVNTMSEASLAEIESKFLGDHPNTYTITKALAEHEVAQIAGRFPTTIVRPSMIVGAWREPDPGWTISKNGPQGFIMGAGKGVVRRLPVKLNLIYDYIPVDIVVNTLLLAGWNAGTTKPTKTLVFHCTSSTSKPFTWHQVQECMNYSLTTYPLTSAVWYPTMKLLPSLTLFRISAVLFHIIPAFFLDTMLRLTGGRPILMRLHRNVNKSLGRLAPFLFQEWFFDNSKAQALRKLLTEADNQTFNTDLSDLEWSAFFVQLVSGVRRYIHNEDPKTLPAARRKKQVFQVLNWLVQVLFFTGIWYLTSVVADKKMLSVAWILPVAYAVYNVL